MIISLIGFMGCGKSTTGKKIAKKLSYDFIDLDHYIEAQEKMTISEIFEKYGEATFRQMETDTLKTLMNYNGNAILSLGGGTPCFNDNMQIIKEKSKSFYLDFPAKVLFDRLQQGKHKRPLIASLNDDELMQFINNKIEERRSFYEQADHQMTSIHQIEDQIINLV